MKGFVLFSKKDSIELKLLLKAAKDLNVDMKVVDPKKINVIVESKRKRLLIEGKEVEIPDFVLAAFFLNDPSYGNIAVLEQLENIGVFCINRASVVNITNDKLRTIQILTSSGISVPKTLLVRFPFDYSLVKREFNYPIILKVLRGTGGTGVTLIHDENELKNILTIANAGGIKDELLIQEYIEESKGKDIRVVIIGGKALVCITRQAQNKNEFRSNVHLGATTLSHKLTDEIKSISDRTAEALGLFVGGIDLLESKDGYVVCEVNSIPGFYHPEIDYKKVYKMDIPYEFIKAIKKELLKN